MDAKLVVPDDVATRKRANATITIRNATTQRAEIIEQVSTRRLFKAAVPAAVATRVMPASATIAKPIPHAATARIPVTAAVIVKTANAVPVAVATRVMPTSATIAQPIPHAAAATTSVTAVAIKAAAAVPVAVAKPAPPVPVMAARSDPHLDYAPTDAMPANQFTANRPSILLAPEIDESVLETTQVRIARSQGRELARQGFSLLEVMISLAILATVLSSIGAGIFSLTSAKRSATEETAVSDLMRMWSERIMGGDWEWLGRNRSEDPLNGAWSWQRPETNVPLAKGDFPPLREGVKESNNDAAIQVLGTEHSGLADLHLYLEYYQPIALELCFTPIDGAAARSTWADTRNAYRLMPPIDLRKQIDAVVVRLSATWSSANGGTRRRELVFARVK
jgi:prepilin-type N-terminal cleavage/methylation domain-containing protein